ncbi:periplasmic chaperone for outer membrane proteins Skp [Mesonia phycicola]|uniref:Periplasmic chaperone for outer membrane proteins Skp n=1 Tax=Mesonia phycicola TaxID=579105 RepID=A0A1M6EWM9_9FLAO|nr:OmpH family outer membrane protein [Mesonia phycicola]SHI89884.1 periplasmic chaperone for outer membrane proteins Skp [Mesonia phycicola]
MKNSFLIFFFFLTLPTITIAQKSIKVAYVDMEYILDHVPEYKEATTQLEARTQKWKSEIETKMQHVENMKQELENERVLLTKELIEEREEEIDYEEKAILAYQEEKFGPQGQFIVQKRQLIQPVQDQVFNAVQEIGEKRQYDFIFENSADALLLFSAKRHDISDQVLKIIEVSSRKNDREDKKEDESDDKYKSVEQAEEDKEKAEEREALLQQKQDERDEIMNDRQKTRDSIREARQKEFEERRAKLMEDRQRKKDSLQQLRDQQKNGG